MIISFRGKMKAGKSTAADYIVDNYEFLGTSFHKVSLATSLKTEVLKELTKLNSRPVSLPLHPLQQFAIDNNLSLPYVNSDCESVINTDKSLFRPLLQYWGDYRRKKYPDYFIHKWIEEADKYYNIVVDDIRYPNEIRALQNYSFNRWRSSHYFEDIGIHNTELGSPDGLPGHPSEAMDIEKAPHPNRSLINIPSLGVEEFYNRIDTLLLKETSLGIRGLDKINELCYDD